LASILDWKSLWRLVNAGLIDEGADPTFGC
jgi:hypothetical protein